MESMKEQAKKLVEQMTLQEKATLCTGATYWTTAAVERLGLEHCVLSDGPHGVRKVKGKDHLGQTISERATGFPTSSAMGATWNCALMYEVGQALALESQAVGVDLLLGPAINMKRSALGGRNFEYFSEDPVLTGKLAAATVRGMQEHGVGACVKHFACNNSEHMRMTIDSQVDERTLREIYLRAFEIIVREAQPVSLMGSYNKVNGTYACENKHLLTEILRDDWGFEGMVLSDWLGVNEIVDAVKAGLHLEMPGNATAPEKLIEAVESGVLAQAQLDERVTQLVAVMLWLQKNRQRDTVVDWDKHNKLANRVACEAAVLLKNEKNLLPLEPNRYEHIALIGDFAKHPRSQGGGSSKVLSETTPCVYDELLKRTGQPEKFVYSQGYDALGDTTELLCADAVTAAAKCQLAIVFAGLPEAYESEGYDRKDISMPEGHVRVIEAVAAACPNTIVVLSNGSSIAMTWAHRVDAILECWLGGQSGAQAAAELILGLEEPSGRLSETFPVRMEDDAAGVNFPGEEGALLYGERMFIGYRHFERKNIRPLFPFGFGLSYTSFAYSDLQLSRTHVDGNYSLEVSCKLTNTGTRTGSEVLQLYIAPKSPVLLRPVKELKAFHKIMLAAGQSQTVSFSLDKNAFSCYASSCDQWVVDAGEYDIIIGSSSANETLRGTVYAAASDRFIAPLHEKSMLMEWLEHPAGKVLAEKMLRNYRGFGIGVNGKTFSDLSHFVQRIMLEMPMPRLITASNGSFTQADLDQMLQLLDA